MNELRALKPCPFCGNDGTGPIEEALQIHHNEPEWGADERHTWTVQCDKCTATMGYSDSEDEAMEAWNRRTPDAAEQALSAPATTALVAVTQENTEYSVPAYIDENGGICLMPSPVAALNGGNDDR